MAKRDKSSIYVDAQKLLIAIYEAQFEMDKRDRVVLAVRLLDHTEAISYRKVHPSNLFY